MTLDPQLYNLKDLTSAQIKKDNWDVVSSELRKFGIKVSKERKERLVQGNHAAIHELIKQLYDYDQKLVVFSNMTAKQGTGTASNSEIQFNRNDSLLKINTQSQHNSDLKYQALIEPSDKAAFEQIPTPTSSKEKMSINTQQ